jgi:CelD/BcsL family acetyltransferase involved in cellulose biosynthesis
VMLDRLPLESPAWASLVERTAGALPFHHPAWAATIAQCYGFDAFALALRGARAEDGEYVAGLPVIEVRHPITRRRRWSSLPFTDTCPPLVAPANAARLASAVDVYRLSQGVAQAEISGGLEGVPSVTSDEHVYHVLTLEDDPEAVASRFRPSVRRNVRSARAAGLELRRAASEADMIRVFYPLQVMTRRRLGLPPQPVRFFRSIWRGLIEAGLGHLTIVEAEGRPVAAAVFLEWNGVTVYKYGASDPHAWHLRPNNLLFAEEIAHACRTGQSSFHFGRTDAEDEGLRRFKLGWGATEEPLRSTWLGAAPSPERVAPPKLLRKIVRRSPPFIVRAIGTVLYRYAA